MDPFLYFTARLSWYIKPDSKSYKFNRTVSTSVKNNKYRIFAIVNRLQMQNLSWLVQDALTVMKRWETPSQQVLLLKCIKWNWELEEKYK